MQQRRLRLGDILDDYCPRERRITNHVVAAMVEDQVKQTRCSTCDVDHEYKQARLPARRKSEATDDGLAPKDAPGAAPPEQAQEAVPAPDAPAAAAESEPPAPTEADADADGPVHRPLIRAVFPRPEGQAPERREINFTVRQPGGNRGGQEVDGNRSGRRRNKRSRGQGAGSGGQSSGRSGGGGRPDQQGQRQGGQGRKRGR